MAFRWIGKSHDGNTVTLNKLVECPVKFPEYATDTWLNTNQDIVRKGMVLDVETTGLNQTDDVVIEIGMRQFDFNKNTGEILRLGKSYSAFQDPGRPLSPEIIALTGITDADLEGQKIDWAHVDQLISETCLVIAHNAKFDRPFIDRKSKTSTERIWGCSFKQVDWNSKGFTSPKLELLNIYHGFFTDSHRALNDVDALLYLLSHTAHDTDKTYLHELTNNAKRMMTHVIASSAPFESKEHLKTRGYSWDNTNRFWSKIIFKDDVKNEVTWLEDTVYCGPFNGIQRDIALMDNFK
ncbi:DNA polymerase III subunit epsilon [Bdellovibrio sp. ZAP7]|uniref:3'-5' exonuclease n=1 Tax=Bdellovibrio sp. ZAP7 TaxID=2231053 RepID=UPI001158979F|nr:3'-5' exonuclease [Bdellovibrio sp. ZAP7]QDK45746.1 DNA polymerase III subunit epsilon [Bdellovibrio sp. ZAP7]